VEYLLLRCYGVGLLEGKSVSQFPDVLIRSRVGPLVSSLLVSLLSKPLALKLTSHHVLTLSHFLADLSSGPFKVRREQRTKRRRSQYLPSFSLIYN
jgi:hypothetical protein